MAQRQVGAGTWVAFVLALVGAVVPVVYLSVTYASGDAFDSPPYALFILIGVSVTALVVLGMTRLNLRHSVWRWVFGLLGLYLLFSLISTWSFWVAGLFVAGVIYVWMLRRRSRANGTAALDLARRDGAAVGERITSLRDRLGSGPTTRP